MISANNIYYNGRSGVRAYYDQSIVWEKLVSHIYTGQFAGQMTGHNHPFIYINGVLTEEIPLDETDYTFDYTYTGAKITSLAKCFTHSSGSYIKRIDVLDFDTSNVTDMNQMFAYCTRLEYVNINHLNTSNVTDMSRMFDSCSALLSLDVSSFNTSNVTDMSRMFAYCSKLTTLDVSNFDTSNVTTVANMFQGNSFTSLHLGNLDLSKVETFTNFIGSCYKLTDVTGNLSGIKQNLYFTEAPLTNASVMVFINGLDTVTSKKYLYLTATAYDTLTQEQISLATSKGWGVAKY